MRVFISWSGETSMGLAEVLRQWLPAVIQMVRPYYSPDDIAKGARWNTENAGVLEESKVGLICLTPDNLQAPWIMFEAGALSKNLDTSKVIPILFGVDPNDLTGPLVQFQAAPFDKTEMKRVVRTVNGELGEMKVAADVLEEAFEMRWPKLEEGVTKALENRSRTSTKTARSPKDMLEELLSLTRASVRNAPVRKVPPSPLDPQAVKDLVDYFSQLVDDANSLDRNSSFIVTLGSLVKPIAHIVKKTSRLQADDMSELLSKVDQAEDELNLIIGGDEKLPF